jgi:sulfur carrier protein
VQVVINGTPKEIPPGETVAALLERLGLHSQPCAVEVNRDLVTKALHPTTPLRDGDRVEIVTLVGGG